MKKKSDFWILHNHNFPNTASSKTTPWNFWNAEAFFRLQELPKKILTNLGMWEELPSFERDFKPIFKLIIENYEGFNINSQTREFPLISRFLIYNSFEYTFGIFHFYIVRYPSILFRDVMFRIKLGIFMKLNIFYINCHNVSNFEECGYYRCFSLSL